MGRTRHGYGSPAAMLLGALLFVGIVSASMNPIKRQQATTTTASDEGFESVTGCHLHGTIQYCLADATEYRIVADATATGDAPSSYTDCHNHGAETWCMSPSGGEVEVVDAEATVTAETASKTGSSSSITAITDCHLESSSVFCSAGSTEYYVQTTVTATGDVPAQFTGCHSHGEETYCMTEDDEVAILPAEDIESGEAEPDEEHCHFHAGVEHCTGGGSEESTASCERTDREYKIPIRIGMLFVVLVASSVGVFGPILMSTFVQVKTNLFLTILKQFGTGVIISTAFVHLFTHATMMFTNECLGELAYEGTTAAIVMAGLFISFLIEFVVQRAMRWQARKKSDTDESFASPKAVASAEMANITIMETGIIFHSLLIGITLVVAGDSFFITLSIVIIFHQMFEGIALGTRIASLGHGGVTFSHPGQTHMHAHDAPVPVVDRSQPSTVSLGKKLLLASGFALVTPIGMAIGIGVLDVFNGNDPKTIVAIGTLDALSAGILVWVGLVEMWAHDWMLGGELTEAGALTTTLAMFGLLVGMILMSVLGKWA
ncbi:high-affinity Zn(2+) transporter zrt1 [Neonectria punicea]|uniref:High-affinity Zn(2+) transporter zrt1 n=1 Tax=Neonectria punicea TaxID=979145 RepID=A0ABR1HC62_9HYPO